jgi:hypothetical protein
MSMIVWILLGVGVGPDRELRDDVKQVVEQYLHRQHWLNQSRGSGLRLKGLSDADGRGGLQEPAFPVMSGALRRL